MQLYRLMLVFVVGVYLLSPALMEWWQEHDTPWYRPFILWGVLIFIAVLLERSYRRNEF